jgi:hypothetical protein
VVEKYFLIAQNPKLRGLILVADKQRWKRINEGVGESQVAVQKACQGSLSERFRRPKIEFTFQIEGQLD